MRNLTRRLGGWAWRWTARLLVLGTTAVTWAQNGPAAAVDARMLRYADVSETQIAFVYAGDIWVVPKTGGAAQRLSSPRGEESFPRFSPDGTQLAFTGNYDGNPDLYVISTAGGLPRRVTHHGATDRMLDWYPDGRSLLYATMMTSQKDRFYQLYRVPAEGGLPARLAVPYGESGAISPDGKRLAYTPLSVDFRTWKRYRGGMNPDIWLFDLEPGTAENITRDDANDAQPMWHGDTLYFLSDRDAAKRANLWTYDLAKKNFRPVTAFTEFDVRFPAIGPKDIVFENGGRLHLLDLATGTHRPVDIQVTTDHATLKPRAETVGSAIQWANISPNGKRAVFSARGEVFTVPVEHGVIRNLTQSSGVAERYPTWSPDGKLLAYFSDRSGEYELTLRAADGSGGETNLTQLGSGFRFALTWSPDSQKLVFIDQAMKIHLHDLAARTTRPIDQQMWLYYDDLQGFEFHWSADSRWLAYAGDLENRNTAIILFDTQENQRHQVTRGYYSDDLPVFDPDGKYLYFRSGRTFTPTYSELDPTWVYANTANLLAVPLRKDVPSPLAPRNDDEGDKDKEKEKEKGKETSPAKDAAKGKEESTPSDSTTKKADEPQDPAKAAGTAEPKRDEKAEAKKEDKKDEKPKPVLIDLEGFEARAVILPPKAGRYADLAAVSGKLLFRRLPRTGSGDEKSALVYFDFEKREEKTVLDDVDGLVLAAKGEKVLVRQKNDYAIVEPKDGQKWDKKLATGNLETVVDPPAEWRQLFTDAWRFQRDFFYDPGMHQVDWETMRVRYGTLLKDAVTRWDVDFLLGELIAELNASHTYRSGGDTEKSASRGVGYLGVDFALANGAYRFQKIIEAAPWDTEARSPLRQPGVDVKEGDYLLAVNGVAVDPAQDPWAAFQGLADKPVFLTVNSQPTREGAREVLIQTLAGEARLRHLAWIESNRQRVEAATDGQVGYVYVPDTGAHGQNELVRQFRAQFTRPGLIVDERFNSGGQIPDRFVELLNRPVLNYWGVRDGKDWAWPPVHHEGPKAMLVNGWSGSGGDCFPFYFQKAKLGPLIGTRTWGGLIGITGAPPLIDGGNVTVPTFGIYSTKGEWIIEGYGVDPDIPVVDDPAQLAKGIDPQLERAIKEVQAQLKKHPPQTPRKPAYPDRRK